MGSSSLDREGGFAAGVCVWVLFLFGNGAFSFWGGRVRLGMESRFFVEAKSFSFSADLGKPELRLEERRRGFAGIVFLGPRCVA